jgi:hypothetical protein
MIHYIFYLKIIKEMNIMQKRTLDGWFQFKCLSTLSIQEMNRLKYVLFEGQEEPQIYGAKVNTYVPFIGAPNIKQLPVDVIQIRQNISIALNNTARNVKIVGYKSGNILYIPMNSILQVM